MNRDYNPDKKAQRRSSSRNRSIASPIISPTPRVANTVSVPVTSRPRKDQTKRQAHKNSNLKLEVPPMTSMEPLVLQNMPLSSPSPNKRGQVSMNHLLNFNFPPRQQAPAVRRRQGVSCEPFVKERYINANFRFVLYPNRSYETAMDDSDVILPWEDVAQVLANTDKEPSCPICLSVPTAPRMTKCGHTYCGACLEHYVALGDRNWRKCPICYDSVYIRDLKPVAFFQGIPLNKPSPFQPISLSFTLMSRHSACSIALPKQAGWSNEMPVIGDGPVSVFSRYCLGSLDHMKDSVWTKDLEALAQYKSEVLVQKSVLGSMSGADQELPFIDLCMDKLQESILINELPEPTPKKFVRHTPKKELPKEETTYYFYQSSDGRTIFLHPLDIKVLKHEFGGYEAFPEQIQAPVISIQESTVNQGLRKKCKYLSHLPLSCDVTICDVDLSDIISESTRVFFSGELASRLERLQGLELQKVKPEPKKSSWTPQGIWGSEDTIISQLDQLDPLDERPPSPLRHKSYPSLLSTSPPVEISSPRGVSFAQMAKAPRSRGPSKPRRLYGADDDYESDGQDHDVDDFHGWTLDFEEASLSSLKPSPVQVFSGKKSKKKQLLVSNSGHRSR